MDLYFSPLACSLAPRIAAYEAGLAPRFVQVDLAAKKLADGSDYFAINPMGQVPAIRTDDGMVLTEVPAVLQFIADARPDAGLAPGGMARYQLQQWLNFVTSELHKAVFNVLFTPKAPDDAKAYARAKANRPLDRLEAHLAGRDYLLDQFSVADAYLVTALTWTRAVAIDLKAWPNVLAYYKRVSQRPMVAKAMAEEYALYQAEQAKVA